MIEAKQIRKYDNVKDEEIFTIWLNIDKFKKKLQKMIIKFL